MNDSSYQEGNLGERGRDMCPPFKDIFVSKFVNDNKRVRISWEKRAWAPPSFKNRLIESKEN